jgi:Xaa-Pro aminopeptidase
MFDPKERLTQCISTAELERRWELARQIMQEHDIDYLLMRQDEEFLGGYVKWFSDFSARHSYPYTVIFPADDEMTLITSGPIPPGDPFPPAWAVRGVKNRLAAPYFSSVHYTDRYDAELAAGVLKEQPKAKIGLVGRTYIPIAFFDILTKELPGATFVDMTEEIDNIMVPKSEEELALIRRTAALQDEAMAHVARVIKPGMRDFEVLAAAQWSCVTQGSERQLILACSAPKGQLGAFQFRHFQNRIIQEGDQFSLLIEVNGPGGFYTELARIFSFGPPSQELKDAYDYAVETQQYNLGLMKPGAKPGDILEASNAFLAKGGYKEELRLYAHGQGYNLVERPLFLPDETMTLQAGMNIVVHPAAVTDTVWANVCDNYIMTADGPSDCIHHTPKKIIEL